MQRMAEQCTTRGPKLFRPKFRRSAPGQVLPRDPLGHETHPPGANVLVGAKDVAHSGVRSELMEEQICLVHTPACCKRPIRSHAFTRHALSFYNAGIGVPTR